MPLIAAPLNLNRGEINIFQTNMATTSPVAVFSKPHASFRSAKFYVQTTLAGVEHVVREILAVHDGADAFLTEYAVVSTDEESDALGDVFEAEVSGSLFVLNIIPSTSTSRAVTVHYTSFKDAGI